MYEEIRRAIERSHHYHSRLVIVTGPSASLLLEHAASENGLAYLNLSLSLSEKLIEVPKQDRARSVVSSFSDLLQELKTPVVLMNHIEILFDKTLSIEPLKLLQSSAKNITLVVAWPGGKNTSSLTYAVHNHPEYRCYKVSDFGETIFVDAGRNR